MVAFKGSSKPRVSVRNPEGMRVANVPLSHFDMQAVISRRYRHYNKQEQIPLMPGKDFTQWRLLILQRSNAGSCLPT